ncbi:mitochondrial-processing peptidase alpha subunit [Nannochloropsis gaditana]|uniref:Mitochondrial-processing peptidase alpha subunit n=1 Tax=Nannochloropsis gaditana TaxID=72520 RepID=W7U357_9STRA|nr:mitochondrial-processing peptidase alpha subunit [Nannochloropsis gaditana]
MMWRLTRATKLHKLLVPAAGASGRGHGRGLASSANRLVDLDEEYPDLPALNPSVASPFNVETSTLSNGVKVVSTLAGKTTSVGLSVAAGSLFEVPGEEGSALLLQHLAFKGTSKRSALRLLRDLESVGAAPSALAGRESLLYKVTALPEYAESALEAAFETALSPKITPYLVSELQTAAAADMETFAADARLQLGEALYEAAYGENTPLGHPLYHLGSQLTAGSLAAYRAKTYGANFITVFGTGVAHAQLASWATRLADGLAPGSSKAAPASPYIGGEARLKATSDSTFVGLALCAPDRKDAGVLEVLAAAWQSALPAGAAVFTLPGLVGVTGAASPTAVGSYVDALFQVVKGTGKDFATAKKAAQVAALTKLDGSVFEGLADGRASLTSGKEASLLHRWGTSARFPSSRVSTKFGKEVVVAKYEVRFSTFDKGPHRWYILRLSDAMRLLSILMSYAWYLRRYQAKETEGVCVEETVGCVRAAWALVKNDSHADMN